jgi:hypothetical protein
LRRTVLAPTTLAAVPRARQTLAAIFLFAVLVLALAIASPVAAQEETTDDAREASKGRNASGKQEQAVQGSGQQAEDPATDGGEGQAATSATDPLQNAAVTIKPSSGTPRRIEIAAADCDVEKGATVSVDAGNGATTFVDGVARNDDDVDAGIQSTEDQVVIDEFAAADVGDFRNGSGEVAEVSDSSGVTCGAQRADDENNGNGAKNDNLENLTCDDLLVLFRGDGQYEDDGTAAVDLNDSNVRAQIEVCLKKEIVNNPGGDLPDTGGVSLLAVAVFGIVSAAAGLSVIRGGRRQG